MKNTEGEYSPLPHIYVNIIKYFVFRLKTLNFLFRLIYVRETRFHLLLSIITVSSNFFLNSFHKISWIKTTNFHTNINTYIKTCLVAFFFSFIKINKKYILFLFTSLRYFFFYLFSISSCSCSTKSRARAKTAEASWRSAISETKRIVWILM